jgi:hypothetical protein
MAGWPFMWPIPTTSLVGTKGWAEAHYLKTIVEELNQLFVSVVVVIRVHVGIVPPGRGGRFGDERIEVAGVELLV